MRRPEDRPPRHHVISRAQQGGEHGEHRRHTTGRGNPVFGPLHRRQLLYQLVGVGIGVATIDVATDLIGEEGAQYLADLGVVAVGSDTIALEALPSPPGKTFIVHQTLLAKNGVHVLETINTNDLAADSVSEFMFVLGIPKLVGTVQMVINPVAIR